MPWSQNLGRLPDRGGAQTCSRPGELHLPAIKKDEALIPFYPRFPVRQEFDSLSDNGAGSFSGSAYRIVIIDSVIGGLLARRWHGVQKLQLFFRVYNDVILNTLDEPTL